MVINVTTGATYGLSITGPDPGGTLARGGLIKTKAGSDYNTAMAILGNGIGIGTLSPSDPLHVVGRISATGAQNYGLSIQGFDSKRGGLIQTKANADYNTAMAILDTGIGIGTTTPTEKLHVVGNAYITGTVVGGNIRAQYQDLGLCHAIRHERRRGHFDTTRQSLSASRVMTRFWFPPPAAFACESMPPPRPLESATCS